MEQTWKDDTQLIKARCSGLTRQRWSRGRHRRGVLLSASYRSPEDTSTRLSSAACCKPCLQTPKFPLKPLFLDNLRHWQLHGSGQRKMLSHAKRAVKASRWQGG